MLAADPDAVLARLRRVCLDLPAAGERVSHGSPAFDVAGRMFCYFWHNHHGDGLTAACLKVTGRDELDMLIEADHELYSWLPYLSPGGGWIGLCLADPDLDWDHVAGRVLYSWRLAAPRRLAALDPGAAPA